MPKKRNAKKKSKRTQQGGRGGSMGITGSSIYQYASVSYTQQKTWKFPVKLSVTGATSTGAGLLSCLIYIFDPSSGSNWTELASLFDQYRVNKVKITWLPAMANDSSNILRPGYVVTDFDSSTVVSTAADALQYDTCRTFDLSKPFVITIVPPKMARNNVPVGYADCATPVTVGIAHLFAVSLSVTVVYGSYQVEWDCDFKSMR